MPQTVQCRNGIPPYGTRYGSDQIPTARSDGAMTTRHGALESAHARGCPHDGFADQPHDRRLGWPSLPLSGRPTPLQAEWHLQVDYSYDASALRTASTMAGGAPTQPRLSGPFRARGLWRRMDQAFDKDRECITG